MQLRVMTEPQQGARYDELRRVAVAAEDLGFDAFFRSDYLQGIGAGWYEAEHASYTVPFPAVAERFDRLEEQLELITDLWTAPGGKPYSFDGHCYSPVNSPALPKPVQQPRPLVILGGKGPRRTPALTALRR